MWLFKKQKPTIIEPAPCKHKWKDFPWYVDDCYDEDDGELTIEIVEPYVCIHCKERKDVTLEEVCWSEVSKKEYLRLMDEIVLRYQDHLKPRAIVEDMINDYQLVDRTYLQISENLGQTNKGLVLPFTKEEYD